MESLTGLTGFYWILFFGYALALLLAVESLRREPAQSERVGRLLAIPLVAGVTLAAYLLLAFREETRYLASHITDEPGSVPVAFAALVTAVAFVDFFFQRLAAPIGTLLERSQLSARNRSDLALLVGVGLPAVLVGVAFHPIHDNFVSEEPTGARTVAGISGLYELPGHPLDFVLLTDGSGYVSFGEGRIAQFELPEDEDGEVRVTTVATGLRYPRGLTVSGGRLFVAELGPLPCSGSTLRCKGGMIPGESHDATELRIIRTSRARVLSFVMREDGNLGDPQVVLDDLPVVNTDHALNDLATDARGTVYLAIGHLDTTYDLDAAELRPALTRPHADLLGTIVSISPDGRDVEVYAKGLRNLYGMAFDPRGQMYGTDNSGPTRNGPQPEEVLRVERGADYGYPGAPATSTTPPSLRVIPAAGSAGIGWVPGPGAAGRLVIGTCGEIWSVELSSGPDGETVVAGAGAVERIRTGLPACVTSIQPRPGGFVASLFTTGGRTRGFLLPVELESEG